MVLLGLLLKSLQLRHVTEAQEVRWVAIRVEGVVAEETSRGGLGGRRPR